MIYPLPPLPPHPHCPPPSPPSPGRGRSLVRMRACCAPSPTPAPSHPTPTPPRRQSSGLKRLPIVDCCRLRGARPKRPGFLWTAGPGSAFSSRLPLKARTLKQKQPTKKMHHFWVWEAVISFLREHCLGDCSLVLKSLVISGRAAPGVHHQLNHTLAPLAYLEALVQASEFFIATSSDLLPA